MKAKPKILTKSLGEVGGTEEILIENQPMVGISKTWYICHH